MKLKWIGTMRAVLLAVAVCVLMCLGMGAGGKADQGLEGSYAPGYPPGLQRLDEAASWEEQYIAWEQLFTVFPHMVDPSLEVREQLDFNLTPALLVQEAVSDGVILTYPEE
jgi:hypothetical protein